LKGFLNCLFLREMTSNEEEVVSNETMEKEEKDTTVREIKAMVATNNEQFLSKLEHENTELREIKTLLASAVKRIGELEESNRTMAQQLQSTEKILVNEISNVKQLVIEVVSSMDKDKQEIMSVFQDIKDMMSQCAKNRAALRQFNANIRKLNADILRKYNDSQLEKCLSDLLESINIEWNEYVNSGEDVALRLEEVYAVFTRDLQALVTSLSRFKNSQKLFNHHMDLARYLPFTKSSKPKTIEQDFVQVNSASQSCASAYVTPKNAFTVSVDVDENEVVGLAAYIRHSFPQAHKYDPKSIDKTSVILTFIIVHDRIDMNKWIPVCEKRTSIASKVDNKEKQKSKGR
jgi:hypothetical protein